MLKVSAKKQKVIQKRQTKSSFHYNIQNKSSTATCNLFVQTRLFMKQQHVLKKILITLRTFINDLYKR